MNDSSAAPAPPSSSTVELPPNSHPLKSVSQDDIKKAFSEWLADLPDGETLFRPGEHKPEVYADALWDRLN